MEKDLYPLFGIVTVLNTPFTKNDEIDLAGLKRHIAYAIESGVAGFLVPAMASEVCKLSDLERLLLVETTLESCADRVTVIGGAGETDRDRRCRHVKDLLKTGCRNILLQIPYLNDIQYRDDVMRIAELGPDMVMIQDWDPVGNGLSVPLISRLFEEVAPFRCLKIETVPAGPKYSEVLRETGGRLNVSGGWAVSSMIEGLERGVHSFMPTGLHEIYCLIYKLFCAGKIDEATQWFHEVLPILAFANQHLDISIHFFKRLLHAQGIYESDRVRQLNLPFDEFHEKRASFLIDQSIALLKKAKDRQDEIQIAAINP